jgi:hypothetical protein
VHLILGYLIVILDQKKESVDTTKSYFCELPSLFIIVFAKSLKKKQNE